VPVASTLPALLERARSSVHSRWLVYDGSLDNIVGVLHVRRLFGLLGPAPGRFRLPALLQPALVAPASMAADDLLEQLRASRQRLAVLLDEFGGTAGIITLEDLVGALVGHIEPEPNSGSETPSTSSTHGSEPDGSVVFDGLTRLIEFEDVAGIHLDEDAHQVDTLGGLFMQRLGRMPGIGDEIRVAGLRLRVEELDGLRVARVRVVSADAPRARVMGYEAS
jgi:CBS domain containing-hemolysin-like protein